MRAVNPPFGPVAMAFFHVGRIGFSPMDMHVQDLLINARILAGNSRIVGLLLVTNDPKPLLWIGGLAQLGLGNPFVRLIWGRTRSLPHLQTTPNHQEVPKLILTSASHGFVAWRVVVWRCFGLVAQLLRNL